MWTRKDVKMSGNASFRRNYWPCVLATVLLCCSAYAVCFSITVWQSSVSFISRLSSVYGVVSVLLGSTGNLFSVSWALIALCAAGAAADLFLLLPLKAGCYRLFLNSAKRTKSYGDIPYAFRGSYGNVLKTMFLRGIVIYLWSLLLVVPGVIMAYSYRMVPYLLAENPQISPREALRKSREMMNGQKANAFVLDLSFAGWWALSLITAGLAALFYAGPYQQLASAHLYLALAKESSRQRDPHGQRDPYDGQDPFAAQQLQGKFGQDGPFFPDKSHRNNGQDTPYGTAESMGRTLVDDNYMLWLVCTGGILNGQAYPISAAAITIGRLESNTVRYPPDYPGISRSHARLYRENGLLLLMDCNSTAGTFLNAGEKLPPLVPREVHPGDSFYLATAKDSFEIRDA